MLKKYLKENFFQDKLPKNFKLDNKQENTNSLKTEFIIIIVFYVLVSISVNIFVAYDFNKSE